MTEQPSRTAEWDITRVSRGDQCLRIRQSTYGGLMTFTAVAISACRPGLSIDGRRRGVPVRSGVAVGRIDSIEGG